MPTLSKPSILPAAYDRPAIDEIRTSAITAQNQSVLIQENFDPGWRAWVDGVPAKIETDIMGFMRVRTNPGSHRIRFVYRESAEAFAIAAVSLASLLVAAVIACDSRRRAE